MTSVAVEGIGRWGSGGGLKLCLSVKVGGGGCRGDYNSQGVPLVLTFRELSSNINSVSEPTPLKLKHFFG